MYARAFGARRAAAYDPFQMIIWEDAAERITPHLPHFLTHIILRGNRTKTPKIKRF